MGGFGRCRLLGLSDLTGSRMSQTTVVQDPKAPSAASTPALPQKSFVATWLLAWLLGTFGADRFYLGKVGTAVARPE